MIVIQTASGQTSLVSKLISSLYSLRCFGDQTRQSGFERIMPSTAFSCVQFSGSFKLI